MIKKIYLLLLKYLLCSTSVILGLGSLLSAFGFTASLVSFLACTVSFLAMGLSTIAFNTGFSEVDLGNDVLATTLGVVVLLLLTAMGNGFTFVTFEAIAVVPAGAVVLASTSLWVVLS